MSTMDTEHSHSLMPYVWVFIALLVLLACAVGIVFIPTDDYALRAVLTTVAYIIATVKALLIVLWFMHVKESSRLTWLFAGGAFFFVAILVFLTLNDYGSRGTVARPYASPPPADVMLPAVPAEPGK